jgi:putative glycosyltransferase (TIGR04348 family)
MKQARVLIISPAQADANNGNWQTAWRWSRMLAPRFQTSIAQEWAGNRPGDQDVAAFDVMLALHARRSAKSISAWAKAQGARQNAKGLAVVLTGTDLYRDIDFDSDAKMSLDLAQQLAVLQECGPERLAAHWRAKARVIFQSTTARQNLPKTPRHLRAVMVGHLRDEKSPQTLFEAARLLRDRNDIFIDHIGEPLDANLGRQAQETATACPNYRWLGGVRHEATRRHIQRAHVLVHASKIEGGAHVVMEAVCSGTPVLASEIAGNVGMLGAAYPGYFEQGNARELADLLLSLRADQIGGASNEPDRLLPELQAHCAIRAPLFAPEKEQAALIQLVCDLLK